MLNRARSLLLRSISKLFASGRGEVRAMQQVLALKGVLRFVALFVLTIVVPSIWLGYLGVASLKGEEATMAAEIERQSSSIADAFWQQMDRDLSQFEENVRDRLEAGRTPLDSQRELHRHLLVALRFDAEGELDAPFQSGDVSGSGLQDRFGEDFAMAARLELKGGDPMVLARAYANAARTARTRSGEGRSLLDRARVLALAGRNRDAIAQFDEVADRFGTLRDPWGFRLVDLARLERARLLAIDDPPAGAAALRGLVENLLAARWTVGEGGEAAVARRAISLLEATADREWVASTRGRLAERSASLFWTGDLQPELERIVGAQSDLRVDAGKLRWTAGDRALWATTWWGPELYVFGLDLEALLSELKADARASVGPDAPVVAYLVDPDDSEQEPFVRRRLSPWLSGWALAVAPRDPESIANELAAKRVLRMVVVGMSVAMIGFGGMLSLILVGRELDVARMKTDFAASVSHELRSPITQIRLKGEELMLGLAETDEERESAYHAIVRESERLSRLVDNVLDFAAIERGAKRYNLRPADLTDTVYRAIEAIASAQELHDRELDVELPDDLPTISHDADAVAQCVINLVSNAAKYSGPGGWIGVRGRLVDGGVEIVVSDQGIGIAPHDLRMIFEPFFRSADASARRRKGTGIGLAITRYIMEAHGGRVGVQSRPGKGSTFTLRFPLQAPT
jgi:signal transduction histidine kinase